MNPSNSVESRRRSAVESMSAEKANNGVDPASPSDLMRRAASHPSSMGRFMSIRMRSGASSNADRTASGPLAASTTRNPAWRSIEL
jgi:hypothetical protein